jgi:hypothetical protein
VWRPSAILCISILKSFKYKIKPKKNHYDAIISTIELKIILPQPTDSEGCGIMLIFYFKNNCEVCCVATGPAPQKLFTQSPIYSKPLAVFCRMFSSVWSGTV